MTVQLWSDRVASAVLKLEVANDELQLAMGVKALRYSLAPVKNVSSLVTTSSLEQVVVQEGYMETVIVEGSIPTWPDGNWNPPVYVWAFNEVPTLMYRDVTINQVVESVESMESIELDTVAIAENHRQGDLAYDWAYNLYLTAEEELRVVLTEAKTFGDVTVVDISGNLIGKLSEIETSLAGYSNAVSQLNAGVVDLTASVRLNVSSLMSEQSDAVSAAVSSLSSATAAVANSTHSLLQDKLVTTVDRLEQNQKLTSELTQLYGNVTLSSKIDSVKNTLKENFDAMLGVEGVNTVRTSEDVKVVGVSALTGGFIATKAVKLVSNLFGTKSN